MDETDKAMTLRMPAAQRREAEVVARVEGVSVNELVRTALAEHIARKRDDEAFRAQVARIIKEDAALLKRLA